MIVIDPKLFHMAHSMGYSRELIKETAQLQYVPRSMYVIPLTHRSDNKQGSLLIPA